MGFFFVGSLRVVGGGPWCEDECLRRRKWSLKRQGCSNPDDAIVRTRGLAGWEIQMAIRSLRDPVDRSQSNVINIFPVPDGKAYFYHIHNLNPSSVTHFPFPSHSTPIPPNHPIPSHAFLFHIMHLFSVIHTPPLDNQYHI